MYESLDLSFAPSRYPAYAYRYDHYMSVLGVSKADAKRIVKKTQLERVWLSTTHQVAQNPTSSPIFGQGQWLSIKSREKSPILDRATLAHIMRALLPGYAGFELLPAPSRLVDSANQYHIWAFPKDNATISLLKALAPPLGDETFHWTSPWFPEDMKVAVLRPSASDWRELYLAKENSWPGQEGALFWSDEAGAGIDGHLLVLPRNGEQVAFFPFGFNERLVQDEGESPVAGSRQRRFSGEQEKLK